MATTAVVVPTVDPSSALFATGVEHYKRHGARDGKCPACGTLMCPVRPHALSVIAAAGVDPRQFGPPASGPAAVHWTTEQTAPLPVVRASAPVEGSGSVPLCPSCHWLPGDIHGPDCGPITFAKLDFWSTRISPEDCR